MISLREAELPDKSAEEFQRLYRKLTLALEASHMGIWEHNLATDEVTWDKRLCELYGVEFGTLVSWVDHVYPPDRERACAEFDAAIAAKSGYSSQFRILLPDGKVRHVRSRAHYYEDQTGTAFFIGAEWDVTADVLMQEELLRRAEQLEESHRLLEHSALHDFLSGLPNRRGLERFLSARAAFDEAPVAVLHIDLDHFKDVNDRLGHDVGDQVLRAFSLRLMSAVAAVNGFAARTGGDEFIVVLDNTSLKKARAFAGNVVKAAEATRDDVDIRSIGIGASVGIAFGKGSFEQLLEQSDLALYKAKQAGRHRYHVFEGLLRTSGLPVALGARLN